MSHEKSLYRAFPGSKILCVSAATAIALGAAFAQTGKETPKQTKDGDVTISAKKLSHEKAARAAQADHKLTPQEKKELEEAMKEVAKIGPEIEKAMKEANIDIAESMKGMDKEIEESMKGLDLKDMDMGQGVDVPRIKQDIKPIHINIPTMKINVPAIHIHIPHMHGKKDGKEYDVPPINVDVPTIHINVPAIKWDIPAIHIDIPAIHTHPAAKKKTATGK